MTSTGSQAYDSQTGRQGDAHEGEHDALAHILPGWFQRFQEVAFLPLMIVAEMLINGVMMASGLVGDVNNPFAGGVAHWLSEATWVALFLAGAVMGGMAIRTSAAASYWFSRNAARALFNVVGMLGFVALEVWASVMQRSYNPIISPADKAALAWLGFAHPSVSITDIVVALALPLAAMFWGFSTMKPSVKSAAEVAAEGERRVAEAEANARVRQAKAAGWGATLRAGTQAAFAQKDDAAAQASEPTSLGKAGGFDPDNPGGGMRVLHGGFQGQTADGADDASYGKPAPSSQKLRPVGQVGGVPVGWISGAGLASWLRDTLQVEVTASEAQTFVRAQPSARRCLSEEHVQGSPYIAQKAPTLQAARRKWGARVTTQVSGE